MDESKNGEAAVRDARPTVKVLQGAQPMSKCIPKDSGFIRKLAVTATLAVLISACSDSQPPTLDELIRRPDFQQCLLDSGVRPDQLSDCIVANPDEPSARACIRARVGVKYGGSKSDALDRCYDLGSQPPPIPSQIGLSCYQGLTGSVSCR